MHTATQCIITLFSALVMTASTFHLNWESEQHVQSAPRWVSCSPPLTHQTQCHTRYELSSALTEQWQLNETHRRQPQSAPTWQMKYTAAASRGRGREKCTDLVRSCRAAETRRLLFFLQSSLSPLLLSLSSPLLSSHSACMYVCVSECEWAAPSPSASQLLSLGSSQEMNGSAQRTVVLANDLPRVTWSAKCRVGRWVEAS